MLLPCPLPSARCPQPVSCRPPRLSTSRLWAARPWAPPSRLTSRPLVRLYAAAAAVPASLHASGIRQRKRAINLHHCRTLDSFLAGGTNPKWTFSVLDESRSKTFVADKPFTPTLSGTTYTAALPLEPLATSGGVFYFTVTITTDGGVATTAPAGPVGLGKPAAPLPAMTFLNQPSGLSLLVSTPQTVSVTVPGAFVEAAKGAEGAKAADVTGTTKAIQPTQFLVVVK